MHAARQQGLTLVEVLVAVAILSAGTALAWRGIDAMHRTQQRTAEISEEAFAFNMGLQQWMADLDAMHQAQDSQPLQWHGNAMRLLRQVQDETGPALAVVVWKHRAAGNGQGQWMRWQSAAARDRKAVEQAWRKAQEWAATGDNREEEGAVRVMPLSGWQVYFNRGGAWTNPQSSSGAPAQAGDKQVPTGIRVVLEIPAGKVLQGQVVRDWINPLQAGGKS